MDQRNNYEQVRYNNVELEARNETLGSANQRFFHDPSSNINTNIRPPDYNMSVGARPVLNYSIQTGEEFALEFMRERVNPRQHFIQNVYGDPNTGPVYMDLKGILGISHTGSESGSDISVLNTVEKPRAPEFERKPPAVQEDKSYYESMRSVPRSSSRNDSSRGHQSYLSSSSSLSSSNKVKFLCSFGGKILPRPSDGKLRYVGGETRIIRLSRDITWQELVQKTLAIYNQAHTIKYQLPGEDLDALVSVSCNEDLQNMMEECNVLGDGGSQKPRIFLCSSSDLEDSQYGLGSVEGDSEIQYVVAVNGMDLGSRKNSIAASTSGNNLDELLGLNVQREADRTVTETAAISTTALTANAPASTVQSSHAPASTVQSSHAPASTAHSSHAPSSTIQSSQPVVVSSSSTHESSSQPYLEQKVHHAEVSQQLSTTPQVDGKSNIPFSAPLQYGYGSQPSNYVMPGEGLVPMPFHGHVTPQAGLAEDKMHVGFQVQDPEASVKEVKLKRDSSAPKLNEPEKVRSLDKAPTTKEPKMKRDTSLPKINETEKIRVSEKEYNVPSHAYDSSVPNHISKEEGSATISVPDISSPLLSTKNFKKPQEVVQNLVAFEVVTDGRKNIEDEHFKSAGPFTSGAGGSEADPNDFSHSESSVISQRVFHSERIPREQAEMNRLSKSDDSFGSQFLMTQVRSDSSQPISESVEKILGGILAPQADQSVTSTNPLPTNRQTVIDGLAQFEKYKDLVDKINSNIPEEGPESIKKKSESNQITVKNVSDEGAAGLNHSAASQGASVEQLEDPSLKPSDFERIEEDDNKNAGNPAKGHEQPLVSGENPNRATSNVQPAAPVSTSEQGDILIDINDRFPRDLLSDIFSKVKTSSDPYDGSPFPGDGAGLSLNMENHEPKRWSYFRNLAQDEFVRKDVSLMDQDHLGFSSPLTNVEGGAPIDYSYPPLKSTGTVPLGHLKPQINFEDIRQESTGVAAASNLDLGSDYNKAPLKGDESSRLDGPNHNVPESEYEDGKLDIQNTGIHLVDLSLGEIDISTLQIIKNEDLEELRELGSGTFGTVYHGKWRGTDVAIKRIKKSCFTGRSSEQERLTVEFWREADILSKLHHPNVVAFYGVVQDGPGGTLATVTEYMVNGSLRHVLLSKDRHLDRRKRLIIAMDAAFGMEYLHSKNIVHFDLKCDNLLVNLKDPVRPICKVGDFGLSKIKRNTLVTGGVRGTLPWMAPELLNGSSSKVSEKVDVFSFGIVLWEILTGEEPYANMHYGAIIGGIVSNTLRPPVPAYCDPEWRLLMEQCWAPDPVVRPSFTEIARRLRIMSTACQTKPHGNQLPNQVSK
ncbi:Phox/Bem1p [Corchorus olitorius]|uniref:Phox/Bem1p n=1 Tax=Corchorus olitorius TaxID=93759 RepID=A0A1R3JC06_9ROSI|nr:Phox/Bem1p [Corchorus olitorius]